MKALKAFIKPFEVLQRSVKIKFNLIFFSIQLSEMHGKGYLMIIGLTHVFMIHATIEFFAGKLTLKYLFLNRFIERSWTIKMRVMK